jgi:hypothetical protein
MYMRLACGGKHVVCKQNRCVPCLACGGVVDYGGDHVGGGGVVAVNLNTYTRLTAREYRIEKSGSTHYLMVIATRFVCICLPNCVRTLLHSGLVVEARKSS